MPLNVLSSRTVHLEVAHSLTTDAFLGVFSRFVLRRGRPACVNSNNGTNISSGDNELRKNLDQFNQSRIDFQMTQQHIKWHYIPPYASHMACGWESLIGSTKRILRALADQQRLTDKSFLSFMCKAERIMNDRPITSSDDPNSPPLTPFMLLTGRNNQTSAPSGIFEERGTLTWGWGRPVQYLSDVFWKRWLREYLPALQF